MKPRVPALLGCLILLFGCATGYLAKQGRYLLSTTSGTRSVPSVLGDPTTSEATREFLLRVQEIRRFAVEEIGLRDNRNYTRYREIDRDHLVDVVQACDAVSFTPYLWRYPLLGRLPYRGYYERSDAETEAARLEREGYDVIVRPVDAFSTLGLTRDPLYSFMSRYSPFDLASLIIHEQTHATVFVKGQPDFNEALASFVGEEGALEWLERRFGRDSTEYRGAVDGKADAEIFAAMLRSLGEELDVVYRSDLSREEKLARKAQIIGSFRERLSNDAKVRFRTEAYRQLKALEINNAYLSMYRLYTDDEPALRGYWRERCGGDLRLFVQEARTLGVRLLE